MENPRIDFEEEMYDQCAHSYQDGFNSGYKQGQIDTIKRFCNITPQKTNADRIRSMTDEQLAYFLLAVKIDYAGCAFPDHESCPVKGSCYDCWLEWMKKGAEGGGT